jgi:hypothetical protein
MDDLPGSLDGMHESPPDAPPDAELSCSPSSRPRPPAGRPDRPSSRRARRPAHPATERARAGPSQRDVTPGERPGSWLSPGVGAEEAADGEGPDHRQDRHQQQRQQPGCRSQPADHQRRGRAAGQRQPKGPNTTTRRSASTSARSVRTRATRPAATAPASSQPVPAGVRASWAWPIRLTIPAPAAVIDPVIGRWLSTQLASAPPSALGNRRPTRSK